MILGLYYFSEAEHLTSRHTEQFVTAPFSCRSTGRYLSAGHTVAGLQHVSTLNTPELTRETLLYPPGV